MEKNLVSDFMVSDFMVIENGDFMVIQIKIYPLGKRWQLENHLCWMGKNQLFSYGHVQ